jgi:hypothetical protein
MTISNLSSAEAIEAVTAMETVEELREAAQSINISFSGNTGEGTLRGKIMKALEKEKAPSFLDDGADDDEIMVSKVVKKKAPPSLTELALMDPKWVKDTALRRQIVRARALQLVRVKITNLDPGDAQLNGAIVSVLNQYTGKVSKYIPFGEESENGYHIPKIIFDHLKEQKFALRKEIKGGQFGVKKYKTSLIAKFNLEVLPALNTKELENLAQAQRASHAIDN